MPSPVLWLGCVLTKLYSSKISSQTYNTHPTFQILVMNIILMTTLEHKQDFNINLLFCWEGPNIFKGGCLQLANSLTLLVSPPVSDNQLWLWSWSWEHSFLSIYENFPLLYRKWIASFLSLSHKSHNKGLIFYSLLLPLI